MIEAAHFDWFLYHVLDCLIITALLYIFGPLMLVAFGDGKLEKQPKFSILSFDWIISTTKEFFLCEINRTTFVNFNLLKKLYSYRSKF